MIKQFSLIIIFLIVGPNAQANLKNYDNNEIKNFINHMYSKYNFDKKELEKLFIEIIPEKRIKKYFKKAPERTLTWNGCDEKNKNCTNYKKLFVTKNNARRGLEFWLEHDKDLQRAYQKYGVPPEIIIAIIGIESKYGTRTGTFKTFDTLASLSFGPNKGRRSNFFKTELINFLLMCKENNFNPRSIKGSYAGALGQPQFISSSYRHYAVDFNNDKKIDLWNSTEDIIGSVANYFYKNGWKTNQPIMSKIIYSQSKSNFVDSESKKSYLPKTSYLDYTQHGLSSDISVSPSSLVAIIKRKENNNNIYSFGHKNFYVITRYNRSRLYALAVYFLSNEIRNAKSRMERL